MTTTPPTPPTTNPVEPVVRFFMNPEPIYGLWFSKEGYGPDVCQIKLWPLAPIGTSPNLPQTARDHSLGIRFDRSTDPAAFSMGHCPFGAGPLLARDAVKKLHEALGQWLTETEPSAGETPSPDTEGAHTDGER